MSPVFLLRYYVENIPPRRKAVQNEHDLSGIWNLSLNSILFKIVRFETTRKREARDIRSRQQKPIIRSQSERARKHSRHFAFSSLLVGLPFRFTHGENRRSLKPSRTHCNPCIIKATTNTRRQEKLLTMTIAEPTPSTTQSSTSSSVKSIQTQDVPIFLQSESQCR